VPTESANNNSRSAASETREQSTTPNQKKTSSILWRLFSTVLWLTLLAALGIGGYWVWDRAEKFSHWYYAIDEKTTNNQQTIGAIQQQLDANEKQEQADLRELQNSLTALAQINDSLRADLAEQQQQIAAMRATTSDDWKLAEAYYLSRMATQRLLMERNVVSALALLQSADSIVRDRADPQLHAVREQLAQDIVALKLISDIDRQGIYLQLDAVSEQVAQLAAQPPTNLAIVAQEIQNPTATENSDSPWYKRLGHSVQQALHRARHFIRITHVDEIASGELEIPVGPAQQQLAMLSLQSLLHSAQLAVLNDQMDVFQSSVQRATELLDHYFSANEKTAALIATLSELNTQGVDRELPDISMSEKKLGEYLDQVHRINGPATSAELPAEALP
jgi:uroporphyrin-III C-methyltransferase